MKLKSYIVFFFFVLPLSCAAQTNKGLIFSEGLAAQKAVLKGGKMAYGFVDQKGKVKIPHQFDTVYSNFQSGFCSVGKSNYAGVVDKKGKVIIPFSFKEVGAINKFFIPLKSQNGLWGFYTHEGEKVADHLYENFRYGAKGKIIVQQEGKWGIINDQGQVVLDHHYKGIQHTSDRNYIGWKVTQWKVKNMQNQTILSQEFDSLRYVGQGVYKFSMVGKKGLLDEKGKLITKEYEEINVFRYGLSKCRKGKYGVINAAGKVIVPPIYEDLIIDSLYIRIKSVEHREGKFIEKWGLLDHKGNILIKPKYAMMNAVSEGMIAAMREGGTWGYIAPSGSTEIIFRYIDAEDFKNGRARVKVPYWLTKKDLYAIIDKKGEYIISPADYNFYDLGLLKIEKKNKVRCLIPIGKYSSYEKINATYVRVMRNGKYGMILTNGREIIAPVYDYVSDPSDTGLIIVEKDGKTGVVDERGNFTYKLSNRFEKVFGFHEGLSKMQLKGKYGFMDQHGDIWISAQYPDAGKISDGMVNVIIKGKWGFMNSKESLKVQPYYKEVKPFKNGVALVRENQKWNIVNKEGKELHKNDLDKIEETESGKYKLYSGDRVGMADKDGREILALKYEDLEEINDKMFLVKKNGLWGVLDKDENFILPIEHDIIIYEPANNTFITGTVGMQEQVHIK